MIVTYHDNNDNENDNNNNDQSNVVAVIIITISLQCKSKNLLLDEVTQKVVAMQTATAHIADSYWVEN